MYHGAGLVQYAEHTVPRCKAGIEQKTEIPAWQRNILRTGRIAVIITAKISQESSAQAFLSAERQSCIERGALSCPKRFQCMAKRPERLRMPETLWHLAITNE